MNYNDPKVIKQLLGQGLRTDSDSDSASAVNPDSEGARKPRKQAAVLIPKSELQLSGPIDTERHDMLTKHFFEVVHGHSTIGQEAAARIADALVELLTVASSQNMEMRVAAIIDGVVTERAQGSEACGPSAPVDEAAPKEKNDSYFSTHLKRTGDFIEPADY